MIQLKDILYKVAIDKVIGNTSVAIRNIEFDSRKIQLNDVFVAIRGALSDGHNFIKMATDLGALVIICEVIPKEIINGITYVQVANSHKALSFLAANYYENPSDDLKLIGVTGTNGKTTITSLLFQLFKKAGYKVGLLSTVKIMVDHKQYDTTHTTPDSLTINMYLKENKGIKGLLVPSSRVSNITSLVEDDYLSSLKIVGFDTTPKNVQSIKEGRITFLISQKSFNQGYKSVISMSYFLVYKQKPSQELATPLEIITKENVAFSQFDKRRYFNEK